MTRYLIDPDNPLWGCNRLGHSWDEDGDCRHCSANLEDFMLEGFRP